MLQSVSIAQYSAISIALHKLGFVLLQSEAIDNTVFIYFETETIPMPVDTTAVYILSSLPSQSRTLSSIAVTSELSSLPVSSLNTIEVTVPLVTPTTSVMLISTVVVTSVVAGTTEGSR